jgi:hypothetical protein
LDGKVLRGNLGNRLNGQLPTLSPEVEKEIAAHTIKSKSFFFGTTFTDCRKLAYEVAEENGFKHVFNKDLKMVGEKLYHSITKWHHDIQNVRERGPFDT